MALIRSLDPGSGSARPPQSEVDATYLMVDDPERGPVVKITTYGSDARKSAPKPSQVIEFDRAIANELVKVFKKAFGALDLDEASAKPRD